MVSNMTTTTTEFFGTWSGCILSEVMACGDTLPAQLNATPKRSLTGLLKPLILDVTCKKKITSSIFGMKYLRN